jgi:hypothetical protein
MEVLILSKRIRSRSTQSHKGKILYVNVMSASGWLLGIAHRGTAIIVLVCNSSGFLGNVKIPKNAPDKETHSAYVHGGHQFSLHG